MFKALIKLGIFLSLALGFSALGGDVNECNRFLSFLVRHSHEGAIISPLEQKVDSFTMFHGPLINDRFVDFEHTNWYDPKSVYVGIANHTTEGSFHFYFIAGDLRLDGTYGPALVREGKDGNIPYGTKGVLFKLPVGEDQVSNLKWIIKNKKGVQHANCLVPVLYSLAQAGIGIEAFYAKTEFASPVSFFANLMRGNIQQNGQRIPVHVLESSRGELLKILRRSVDLDSQITHELSRSAPQ